MSNPVLTPELALRAYASGIFPMAEARDDAEIFWVDPKKRGVIPLHKFHISKSLARRIRQVSWTIAINQDFQGVVLACADRPETWINDTIFDLYTTLHVEGFAHSLEVWDGPNLIGGVYGVTIGGAFFGESMFSRQTDASKVALAYLVDRLRIGGFTLFDTQFVTDHLITLGAEEITRATYHQRLTAALNHDADFYAQSETPTAQAVLQRNTQTS